MSRLVRLLGEKLVNNSGEDVDVASLSGEGKIVGLYFSAHWCGPCRTFTPELSEFYNKLKQGEKKDCFDIVFISSDGNKEEFDDYYKPMPWLALPWAERARKVKIATKFKVNKIPTLVFIDSLTGNSIITCGRDKVISDPEGTDFPWKPKEVKEMLGSTLKNDNNEDVPVDSLKGKQLCLYFGAEWCPPCKEFSPTLIETYKKMKENAVDMETIFVSLDRSEDSFKNYFATMPWPAIPFDDEPRRKELTDFFGVNGIPRLIVLDENWQFIRDNGRDYIHYDPEGKEFPWLPKSVCELNDATSRPINEDPCIVYFVNAETVIDELAMMKPVAEKFIEKAKESGTIAPSFFVGASDRIVLSLLDFLKVEDEELPVLAIIDFAELRWYRAPEREITTELITSVTEMFMDNKLEFTVLSGNFDE